MRSRRQLTPSGDAGRLHTAIIDRQVSRQYRRRQFTANGGGVAQPNSHRIRVIRSEIAEPDVLKYISAIIESNQAESFLDRQRNAKLRIQDEEFAPTGRHPDQSTG